MECNELTYCVYAIRCKANGKVYIGTTKDVEARIKQHWSDKRRIVSNIVGSNCSHHRDLTPFESDFAQYDTKGFEIYVLEKDIPKARSREREDYWICEYCATDPRYGYNRVRSWLAPPLEISFSLPPNLSKA